MGFFDKTRYLRALLYLTPIGLGFIYLSIRLLFTSVVDLPKYQGVIESIEHTKKEIKFRNQSDLIPLVSIKLSSSSQDYFTTITEYMNIIDSSFLKGDKVTIWVHTDTRKNEIAQIEKEGVIIIPYEKASGVAWGFLVAGIITSFIAIGYLIKYPEDLLGRKKDKK